MAEHSFPSSRPVSISSHPYSGSANRKSCQVNASKAANTLAIDRQNQELQQKLTDAEIQVSVLEQEKERLTSQSNRNWFITGSAVLLGGVLLGLILPRMKFQRRSRYDRF